MSESDLNEEPIEIRITSKTAAEAWEILKQIRGDRDWAMFGAQDPIEPPIRTKIYNKLFGSNYGN